MKAELKAKWIAALKSGKYQQANGFLSIDNKFCCLGVLCDVVGVPYIDSVHEDAPGGYVRIYEFSSGRSSDEMIAGQLRAGLGDLASSLAEMNDGGDTFDTIADYIAKHVPEETR